MTVDRVVVHEPSKITVSRIGAQGPQGDPGATGAQGSSGVNGSNGTNGSNGVNGRTTYNGSGAPSNSLGADGDFYIATNTWTSYGPKASGTWPTGASLVGPQGTQGIQGIQGVAGLTGPTGTTGATGPQGTTGATGPTGSTGSTGATGAAGADGKTVRSGSGVPSGGLGVDGDFYINTTANTIYGPKTSGAWGSSSSLIGPTGATGATGSTGPTGPTGATGATGSTGATGPAGLAQETVNGGGNTGSAVTIPDVTTATGHTYTMTANCTFTFPAAGAGKGFTLQLTQDGTGSRPATWPSSSTVWWSAATTPTLSTGAGKVDLLSFICLDGTHWVGTVVALDAR